MDILTYVNVKLQLSPGRAGGLPFLFIAVPALAPDLTKIMAKYRRHDPPDEEEWRAA